MSNSGHGSPLAQPLRTPSAGRFAAYVGLFLLGAVVAFAGTLVQAAWFPGGLLLALAGAAGLFIGGAYATEGRGGAVAPAVGWTVSVILLTTARPEGDFFFGAAGGSYLFLFGGMALAVICATLVGGRQTGRGPARLGK
ncbi:hypothetical protein LK07_23010 [Streptomyces pluripotens]|uniref:Integral membrane protein n=1 Tax=Streptomyces pluripotens TaxID=1355015 RepID=A0A221P2B6_9ACTN|nr:MULTISPECIES: DUF6113 family protein [Streptomyces]ARP72156.1 hypothetical protein LK06_021855 [Streptomyces pluripotens]ASN26403.1 hypothetical protein LK07_23010 [Streptomyces pluripotens]KIE22958.1 membrane protein [Streptomyces sp. MUSC 125]MCH0556015.1 hypothetical protein [Streptomyces sp. MUM 16J]